MQRPDPNKMFRFPSLALSLVMVGRSGGQKKKKKERMNTWRGLGSRECRDAK